MIVKFFSRKKPVICPRNAHCVSRKNIDPAALRVLYRLADSGCVGYLVGGSVRDLLLGRRPKDFDVGTDAQPNAIRKLFRNCFLVGRRFRLAHIVFGRNVIETSTFRRQPKETEGDEDSLYQREDNTFGTPQEDALRRDFTVNGLFYDIKTFSVIDYVGGLKDLETKTLRCIGDPNVRFREDPVRMMRAVRFAARLEFSIDRASQRAIRRHHAEIVKASVPRLLEEVMRLFTFRSAEPAFRLLWSYKLLDDLIPELAAFIDRSGGEKSPVWETLRALDADPIADDASAGLRLAALCYPVFCQLLDEEVRSAAGKRVNRLLVARKTFEPFVRRLRIPKATFFTATSLLDMLSRFDELLKSPSRRDRFVRHTLFPEAFALWRMTRSGDAAAASLLAEWESVAAKVRPNLDFDDEEANASDDAWRAASGVVSDKPRAGFHGGRRRSRPRRDHRRDTPRASDGARGAARPSPGASTPS